MGKWGAPRPAAQAFPAGQYGTSVTYVAPDYGNAGDETITCTAYDHDRESDWEDTNGWDDSGSPDSSANNEGNASANVTVKVWQVTLDAKQNGTESSNCNALPFPHEFGGLTLGEVDHGQTVQEEGAVAPYTPFNGDVLGFSTSTEIWGERSSPYSSLPDYTFSWFQKKTGTNKGTTDGENWGIDGTPDNDAWDGPHPIPSAGHVDGDTRDTQQGGNPDVNKIFHRDAPGASFGPTNDGGAAIGYNRNYTFKNWVEYAGIRVSNEKTWNLQMECNRPDTDSTWSRATYTSR